MHLVRTRHIKLWARLFVLACDISLITIPTTMRSPSLTDTASLTRLFVLLSLLICSQETQVVALPTGVANSVFPTSSTWKNNFTTQFPPTTIVKDKVPGTKGVSSCYSCVLANIEFTFPHSKKQRTEIDQIIVTGLETVNPSIQPFPVYTPPPIVLTATSLQNLSPITNSSRSSIALLTRFTSSPTALPLSECHLLSKMERRGATDCFLPVATGPLPNQITPRGNHPVPRLGIVSYGCS